MVSVKEDSAPSGRSPAARTLLTTDHEGAIAQLERVAVALGYERVWQSPVSPSRFFMERASVTPGRMEVAPMDEAVAALVASARSANPPSPEDTP
jgi:hypothetical protein